MRIWLIAVFFLLNTVTVALADDRAQFRHGHHAVTLPKNCTAVVDENGQPAAGLHYMHRSYARCLHLSRQKHRHNITDHRAQEIDGVEPRAQDNGLHNRESKSDSIVRRNNNYFLITPRHKKDINSE